MKNTISKVGILFFLILFTFLLFISCSSIKKNEYYADESNYIIASGFVEHIQYSNDMTELYIGLSEVPPGFHDVNFMITGKNLSIVQALEVEKKVHPGTEISFIAAPLYLGDGYVVPLASLSVNGEVLLPFDNGFVNLLEWLRDK